MTILAGWIEEIGAAAAGLRGPGGLGIAEAASQELSRRVAVDGFVGVLPLWSGPNQTVGLLVDPETEARSWSAAILFDGQGLTLSSDSRTIVPQFIVQRLLSGLPQTAERLAERWSGIAAQVTTLHRALGGKDDELEPVVEVIRNSVTRAKFTKNKNSPGQFEEAHSSLLRQVDRSPEFHRYANWLDASIAGQTTVPRDQGQFGVWARRVVFLATRFLDRRDPNQKLPAALVHWIIEGDAGIDSGLPVRPTWAARVGAASGEAGIAEGVLLVADEPATGDIVSDGLRQALIDQGMSYTGLAHAEAVVALDERGDGPRAWRALHSATWWAARNTGTVPSALFDGARLLVRRHNWPDVKWVVERGLPT
jgi:hypothetical protein